MSTIPLGYARGMARVRAGHAPSYSAHLAPVLSAKRPRQHTASSCVLRVPLRLGFVR